MNKMKPVLFGMGMLLCSFFLTACDEESREIEVMSAEHDLFCYEGTQTEVPTQIAVDENGLLYTVQEESVQDEEIGTYYIQHFKTYDLSGHCVDEHDLKLFRGTVGLMYAKNDTLYVGAPDIKNGKSVFSLYAIATDTWEARLVYAFKEYSDIFNLVQIDEYLYMIGKETTSVAKDYTLHPDVESYSYQGERIGRLHIQEENPTLQFLQIDFPIDIFATLNGTLGIYQYTEKNGFGILEFSPEELTLTTTGLRPNTTAEQFFVGCEDGFLSYQNDQIGYGTMYFGTMQGEKSEISSTQIRLWEPPVYVKGFAFYRNSKAGNVVERICVADLLQDNKVIQMLLHEDMMDEPYGCGYLMEETVLESEQYALKVLAQDSDFDVYVLSSRNPESYNLKKNGAYYPLNEIEGVQEYLDACFPYVKELATNEDGDIWMLPVALAVPGIVYNKELFAEKGVDFREMDMAEMLAFTEEVNLENTQNAEISLYVIAEEMFAEYLAHYDSFDTELFRSYATLLHDIQGRTKNNPWRMRLSLKTELENGNTPDFYYAYNVYQEWMFNYAKYLGDSDTYGMCGLPNMEEGEQNYGTLTFLMVNPQSETLEDTLHYISSFAKYMLSKKDSFMLADRSTYSDTPFMQECYDLFANGAVYFKMDEEVYIDLFDRYVIGEMELEDMIVEIERRRLMYLKE